MVILKKLIKKTLESPWLRSREYGISPNGSTVYSKDKEAAKKKAEDIAKKIKERVTALESR